MSCFKKRCNTLSCVTCSCKQSACQQHIKKFYPIHLSHGFPSSSNQFIIPLLEEELVAIEALQVNYSKNFQIMISTLLHQFKDNISELEAKQLRIQNNIKNLLTFKRDQQLNSVLCENSCMLCEAPKKIPVNFSAFHYVCKNHISQIAEFPKISCVHCKSNVPIIKKFLLCNYCLKNPVVRLLSCDHKFCSECLKKCRSCGRTFCNLCDDKSTDCAECERNKCKICLEVKNKCSECTAAICKCESKYGKCIDCYLSACPNCNKNTSQRFDFKCGKVGCLSCRNSQHCGVCIAASRSKPQHPLNRGKSSLPAKSSLNLKVVFKKKEFK